MESFNLYSKKGLENYHSYENRKMLILKTTASDFKIMPKEEAKLVKGLTTIIPSKNICKDGQKEKLIDRDKLKTLHIKTSEDNKACKDIKKDSEAVEIIAEVSPELNYEGKATIKGRIDVDNKYSRTDIMDKYEQFNPEYELIYYNEKKRMKVYKVTLNDRRKFALKTYEFDSKITEKIRKVYDEFHIQTHLSVLSNNVAETYSIREKWEHKNKVIVEIMTEYIGEDLEKCMKKLRSNDLLLIVKQLLDVLSILEKHGIAHMDLKPQNMVYNQETRIVKLIDFGETIRLEDPDLIQSTLGNHMNLFHGWTSKYAPPEVIKSAGNKQFISEMWYFIPNRIDTYCFGMTISEILLAKDGQLLPLKSGYDHKLHDFFINTINEIIKKHNKRKQILLMDSIIKKCLNYYPKDRPTFKELKEIFRQNF